MVHPFHVFLRTLGHSFDIVTSFNNDPEDRNYDENEITSVNALAVQ